MLKAFLALQFAYLIGSVSGSLLLGRLRGIDIRTLGSGNAGGTNALRTQGWRFALGTALIDVSKGALAAWLAVRCVSPNNAQWLPWLAVLLATAGHVWPVFHGFRGGKGAATLTGGLLVVWPVAVVWLFVTWLLVIVLTGYVGLATMIAGLVLIVTSWCLQVDAGTRIFSVLIALFLLYTHRSNISRLRAGNELRFERVRVLHRLFVGRRSHE